MGNFLQQWQSAALTSIGFFWMALWAFALGYLISSMIQVLVTRARMQRTMGTSGPKSVALGTFFGFISSSCSFAALATTRSLFQKASFAGIMAFIFSDLVVLPVLRINAAYYGWKLSLYILALLLSGLVVVSIILHYGMVFLDLLPRIGGGQTPADQEFFKFDYRFVLNLLFLAMSAVMV